MFTEVVRRACSKTTNVFRELLLIGGVGILGSQLLIMVNVGQAIGMQAEAASTKGVVAVQVSDYQLNLNPDQPEEVKSVEIYGRLPDGTNPRTLQLTTFSESSHSTYACQRALHEGWVCQTPELFVEEFTGFRVEISS